MSEVRKIQLKANDVLPACLAAAANGERLEVDAAGTNSLGLLKASIASATISRGIGEIHSVDEGAPGSVSEALVQAVARHWRPDARVAGGFTTPIISSGHGFLVPTSGIVSGRETRFLGRLKNLVRESGLRVYGDLLATVAAVGYQAALNAEEHGYQRIDLGSGEALNSSVFRVLTLKLHAPREYSPHGEVASYHSAYVEANSAPEGGWLEAVVVDAGMGMTYPSYSVFATKAGWEETNIYDQDFQAERARFAVVLNSRHSTKGKWGRILDSRAPMGMGTLIMLHRVGRAQGYVAVRAGRTLASFSHPSPGFRPAAQGGSPYLFEVGEDQFDLFLGTAWHVLLPVTRQTEMTLSEGSRGLGAGVAQSV